MSLFWELDYSFINTFRIHSHYVLFYKGHERGNSCPFSSPKSNVFDRKKKIPFKIINLAS